MKSIVLTRSLITDTDKTSLKLTNILKLAVNDVEIEANYRIFHDFCNYKKNIIWKTEPLITKRKVESKLNEEEKKRFHLLYENALTPNTENKQELYFHQGTITCAIDFLIKEGSNNILIVGTNTVYLPSFQAKINNSIVLFKKHAPNVNFYQYSSGNFNLPIMSIKDFIEFKE